MKVGFWEIRMCYCGIRRRRGPLVGAHLGPFWKCLGPLGPIWDPFYLGPIWVPFGAPFYLFGALGTHLGAQRVDLVCMTCYSGSSGTAGLGAHSEPIFFRAIWPYWRYWHP